VVHWVVRERGKGWIKVGERRGVDRRSIVFFTTVPAFYLAQSCWKVIEKAVNR
jgi:hypothetical protein